MARYVPTEIAEREKQGFSAPDASWFKGESIDYIRRRLFAPRARLYDYLDRETITQLVQEHLDGQQNRRLLVWSLLSFEAWLERYAV
jgi:asparagine synthase (glutamine-hydrolysing)